MSDIIKKPYEISLWDEVLTFAIDCFNDKGEFLETVTLEKSMENFKAPEGTKNTKVNQYYKERKLCVIGSDTMESPGRAIQPKLVSNINVVTLSSQVFCVT